MWFLWIIRRFLLLIGSGATAVIIAACYGVGAGIDAFNNIGLLFFAHDASGDPIEGLEVEVNCYDELYDSGVTGADGEAQLYVSEDVDLDQCTATLTDVDGTSNGGEFASQTINLGFNDTYYDVEMSE